MQHHINKLNRMKYLLLLVVLAAIFGLVWFLNRSFVTITISPINAKLTVDNAPLLVNRKGVAKTTLTPGTHSIRLEADEFLSISKEVSFKRGKRTSFDFSLRKRPEISTLEAGARFLSLGKETNEIVYLSSSGKTLMRAAVSQGENQEIITTASPITSARLSGINQIVWSPNKELALFKKNEGVYLFDFQKYDFVHQTENLWGNDIGDVAWAPDNSKIAYFYNLGSEKSLIFANVSNTEKTRVANLADFGIENPYLAWSPDSRYLIVIPRNKDYSANKVYLYDTYSGTLKAVTDIGNQIMAKFSPDSSKIIYSTYSKGTGNTDPYIVSIMDKNGSGQRSLDIRTNTDNVAWIDDNTILAAEYSRSGNSETFFTRSLASEVQSETIQSIETKIVNQILLTADSKIAVYENTDGVFAFNLK